MFEERALSVRQPWAWAILCAGKDVENRSWQTRHRGRLWIHAGGNVDKGRPDLLERAAAYYGGQILRGALLGHVNLLDVVTDSESDWAIPGQFHWLLSDPVLLPEPIPMPGRLSLWRPPGIPPAGR